MAEINPLDVTGLMRVMSEKGESKVELVRNAETQYATYRNSVDGTFVKQHHLDAFRKSLDALKAEWGLPDIGPRPISGEGTVTTPDDPVPPPPDRPQV